MDTMRTQSMYGLDDATMLANTQICIAYGRSGIGGRSENQDTYGGGFLKGNVILTVCDGMGGMNGGQTASRIAATEIIQTILDHPAEKWNQNLIVTAINNANGAIYRKSVAEPRLRGMGTTSTVVMFTPEAAFVTHIGDSRVYQLRRGKKIFRTFDHSKVFEMVSQKMMTEEQARTSSFSNVITRALGIKPSVDLTVEKLPYKKGDRFILCCDGIWNCLPESEILSLFNDKDKTLDEVNYLTENVNDIGIKNSEGHDNLTAIIADVLKNSQYQHSKFRHLKKVWNNIFSKRKSSGLHNTENEPIS